MKDSLFPPDPPSRATLLPRAGATLQGALKMSGEEEQLNKTFTLFF